MCMRSSEALLHCKPHFGNDVMVCVFDDFCFEDIFIACVCVLVRACAYVCVLCVDVCESECVGVCGRTGVCLRLHCIACMSSFQYKQIICIHQIRVIPACPICVFGTDASKAWHSTN